MSDRTFTDKEIQSLLERAAQLQASQEQRPNLGLTFSELEQVAAESGIDPTFLRAALQEQETGVGLRDVHGHTATHVFVERTVPGNLTEQEWEDVVLKLRGKFASDLAASYGGSAMQTHGVAETLGSTHEWRHTTVSGVATTVTIRSVDDKQHLRIQRRVGMASPRMEGFGYGLMASMVISFIAGGIAESVWVLALVLIAATAILTPTIEWLDRRWRQKKLEEIENIADDIAGIIHDEVMESELSVARPEISLDELPDVTEEVEQLHPSVKTRS